MLGIRFAATREQSLSELCLAVVAGGWQPGFHQAVAFTSGTVLCGNQLPLVSVRSSQARLALQQDRN